jgi:hypothetical protein
MELFKRSSHQYEDEVMVRIDLTKEWYTSLMRSIGHDDARFIEGYVKARLQKDKNGYFLRLPYPDVRLLLGALNLLRSKISDEIIKIIPVAFASMNEQTEKEQALTTEMEDALAKFEAMSERQSDLGALIEVFFYQIVPEEHHPFGPR